MVIDRYFVEVQAVTNMFDRFPLNPRDNHLRNIVDSTLASQGTAFNKTECMGHTDLFARKEKIYKGLGGSGTRITIYPYKKDDREVV